ncbi:MAG: UDP-3-O-(3-hydroxymyristoyl)glucosamine N-acyltransferase [Chitinophagales bacterium]|jgi:UDP-3-O-[3-hydroxymyristoyl] glucosamine N-acyltransferase
MQITAAQIAALLGGQVEGNPDVVVHRPMRIEEAGPGDFAFFDHPKYEQYAYSTGASILLVGQHFVPVHPITSTLIRVSDVRGALALLLGHFGSAQQASAAPEVSTHAFVHSTAKVGPGSSVGAFSILEEGVEVGADCIIHPQVYLGRNVRIGDGTILYPGVRIYYDSVLGRQCIVHANSVIGSDGFGFAPLPDGSWKKVPQVGNVVIEDEVELGAGACIDRASLGSTIIRRGAKIDNLVHIAHNVEVGAHTVMAAQVGIAGSSKIGPNCMLGGQTGVAGHISLAKGTRTQAQSGVASTVTEEGKALFGTPAIDYNQYIRSFIVFKQLPELAKQVRALLKANK